MFKQLLLDKIQNNNILNIIDKNYTTLVSDNYSTFPDPLTQFWNNNLRQLTNDVNLRKILEDHRRFYLKMHNLKKELLTKSPTSQIKECLQNFEDENYFLRLIEEENSLKQFAVDWICTNRGIYVLLLNNNIYLKTDKDIKDYNFYIRSGVPMFGMRKELKNEIDKNALFRTKVEYKYLRRYTL